MSRFLRFCIMALIATMCISSFVTQTGAVPLETSPEVTSTAVRAAQECAEGNPCGWGVYGDNSKSKKIKYFMKNVCTCSKQHQCLYSNEDLSITAFVYRCKLGSSTNN